MKKKKDSSSEPTLKEQEKDQTFSCSICDYTSESQSGLNVHMNRMHKTIPQLDGAESEKVCKPPNYRSSKECNGMMLYQCLWDKCLHKYFPSLTELKAHMQRTHKELELIHE